MSGPMIRNFILFGTIAGLPVNGYVSLFVTSSVYCNLLDYDPKVNPTGTATVTINGTVKPPITGSVAINTTAETYSYLTKTINCESIDFRWKNDDGDHSTATWAADLNTNYEFLTDNYYRLRLSVKNNSASIQYLRPLYLEQRVNGGNWTPVGNLNYIAKAPDLSCVSAGVYQPSSQVQPIWDSECQIFASHDTCIGSYFENLDGATTSNPWDAGWTGLVVTDGDYTTPTKELIWDLSSYSYGYSMGSARPVYRLDGGNDKSWYGGAAAYNVQGFRFTTWTGRHFTSWTNWGTSLEPRYGAKYEDYYSLPIDTGGISWLIRQDASLKNVIHDWGSGTAVLDFFNATSTYDNGITDVLYIGKNSADSVQFYLYNTDTTLGADPTVELNSTYYDSNASANTLSSSLDWTGTYPLHSGATSSAQVIQTIRHPTTLAESVIISSSHTDAAINSSIFTQDGYRLIVNADTTFSCSTSLRPQAVNPNMNDKYNYARRWFWAGSSNICVSQNSGIYYRFAGTGNYTAGIAFDKVSKLPLTISVSTGNPGTVNYWKVTSPDTYFDMPDDGGVIPQQITSGSYGSTESVFNLITSDFPMFRTIQAGESLEFEFCLYYQPVGANHTQGDIIEFRLGGDKRLSYSSIENYPRLGIPDEICEIDASASLSLNGTRIIVGAVEEIVTENVEVTQTDISTPVVNVFENITINDELPEPQPQVDLYAYILIDDIVIPKRILNNYISDDIDISSTLLSSFLQNIIEKISLYISQNYSGTQTLGVDEKLQIRSFSTYGEIVKIIESMNITHVYGYFALLEKTISDSVYLNSLLDSTQTANETVQSYIEINSNLIRTIKELLIEQATIHQSSYDKITAYSYLIEDLEIEEQATQRVRLFVITKENLLTDSSTIENSYYGAFLSESIVFIPSIVYQDMEFEGFVLNPENFAVSTYSQYGFKDSIRFGDKYLLSNENGLYSLDNSPTNELCRIQTASMDFGAEYEKQVPQIYIGSTADSELILSVAVDGQATATYKLATNEETTKTIKIGKGLVGRTFQFDLQTDGDIDLDTLEFYPVIFGRKR